MRILLLAILALATGTSCSKTPGGAEESRVRLAVGASNETPAVGDIVVLNANVTTKGRVYFISFNWITTNGPTVPVFSNVTNTVTNVRFTQPGDYTIIMRIYWWDRDNNRKTTEDSVSFVVAPAAPG